jgi:hypothetical protein
MKTSLPPGFRQLKARSKQKKTNTDQNDLLRFDIVCGIILWHLREADLLAHTAGCRL